MDGEEDYLGDLGRFLDPKLLRQSTEKKAPAASPTPVCGESKRNKGKQKWQEKRKASRDRVRNAQNDKLTAALNNAIPETNIGFRMLQQMGYKPGDALGKHGQGSLEPIKVEFKHSRTGLGVEQIQRENNSKKAKFSQVQHDLKLKMSEMSQRDFLQRQRSSWQAGKTQRDYKKAYAALAQLDENIAKEVAKGVDEDCEKDEDEEEEEAVTEEDLLRVLEVLRSRFHYCIYCGCKYDSAAEMNASCPGFDEDAH